MAYTDCLAEIFAAAGRELSDDEITDLYEGLQVYIRRRRKADSGASHDATVRAAADDYAKDMAEAAIIEKRNAALNLKVRLTNMGHVRSQFADMPIEGMKSTLIGSSMARRGARASAAAEQNALKAHYLGGFLADMEKAKLWREWVSGAFDDDIARALEAMDNDAVPPPDVSREATEMAKVVAKWQETARQDGNKAGAWTKKMPGYITRQSHDAFSIHAATYEGWRDFILPMLDIERTFEGAPSEVVLREMWKGLASGVHLKAGPSEPTGFKGPRNLARKVSQERVLHFKPGEWFKYNQRFGSRTLREAVMHGLEMNAQNTGLMWVWGPNPESNFRQVADEILRGIDDPEMQRRFSEAVDDRLIGGTLHHAFKAVDGTTNMPVHHLSARISGSLRAVQRMAKLGMSTISSFTDPAVYGAEMRYQGRTMLSGVGEALTNLGRGRGSDERRQMLGMIGAYSEIMRGDISARFSLADDGVPGSLTKLQQQFFKWNVLSWWTDSHRVGAMAAMSHRLADSRALGWAEVDPSLKRTLGLYNIGEADWDAIRASQPFMADDMGFVVPEAIADRAVADKLRAYYVDRAHMAISAPDQATRAFMVRGTRPGDAVGETIRFIGEFKSFIVSFGQKSLGREIYGRGSNTLREALRNGNGEMAGLANLMVWMTLLGYVAMSTKDLIKGREPRDPLDYRTWLAAMAQGGGFGIYGDFLFGEVNRFGGGILETIAGPTLSTVSDLHGLYRRALDGDDTAAASVRWALQNTPFINLFYTRIALDYLFLWSLQEALSPGSLKRTEKRIERENSQRFIVRPSRDRVRVFE